MEEMRLFLELSITGLGALALSRFSSLENSFERLTSSVESLNEKMAMICEKVNSHEKRIDRLEKP